MRFFSEDLQLDILSRRTFYLISCKRESSFWEKEIQILVAWGTEIAILFVRSAIKHFSSGTFCFVACQKEFSFLKKEVSILLVRAVSEIAILSIRFATKHSFQKNSLLHSLLERILVLEKRILGSCGKDFWNTDSSQDIQMWCILTTRILFYSILFQEPRFSLKESK